MKKRIVRRILSTALAASMILGNIGVPQGLGNVRAEEVDIDSIVSGKTKVTDDEINDLYRKVTYTPQSVHDPSIIKGKDGQWYVFGSHRGVAKTSDLQNWENVNIGGLFGDGAGNVLAPEEAFVNSLYTGTIQVAEAAAATVSVDNSALTNDTVGEVPVNEAVSEPEEETVSESEAVSEEEAVSEATSEEVSETEIVSESETTPEEETASEPEGLSEEADITESEEAFIENLSVESDGLSVDNDAETGTELPSTEMLPSETPTEPVVEEEPSAEEVPEETEAASIEEAFVEESAAESEESVVTADFSVDAAAIEDAVNSS